MTYEKVWRPRIPFSKGNTMKQIKNASELEDIINTNPYILSLEPEETNILVKIVTDFQKRPINNKMPQTKSLLKALKEIQHKQNDLPIREECE